MEGSTENAAVAESSRKETKGAPTSNRLRNAQASKPVRITGVNGTEWAYVTTYVNEGGTADNSVPLVWDWGLFFCPDCTVYDTIMLGGNKNV